MAKRKDEGHEETEDVLKEIEKRITKEYEQAEREIAEKLDDYMRRFEIKDQLKKQAVLNGQITEAEYEQWRLGQVMMGQRWSDMRDTIADDLTNTAQIAKDIANGYMPEVYAINHNYGTYQVEKMAHVNTSYTLYSRDSVARLFNDDLEFYKKAGKSTLAKINAGKQKAWDKKIVQSVMTQSLLQGESIGKIATRLSKAVGETDRKASIRNARTMTTGIQNAGRIDSYKRAKDMGIEMEQEWLATLDGRTRHQHRQLDGQRVPVGEKFKIDGYDLAYPADPSAPAYLVYNCRCTTVPAIKGFAPDADDLSLRNTNHMEEGSYEEWKNAHASHSDPITKQDEIAENMKRVYNNEYRKYAGSRPIPMYRKKSDSDENLHFITDNTYDNLLIQTRKKGANIIRGGEEIERYLAKKEARGVTIADTILFSENVTISDVLEEAFHFEQNINHVNDDKGEPLRTILNEIEAKEYLLKVKDKYKIPRNEVSTTKKQLESYRKELELYEEKKKI